MRRGVLLLILLLSISIVFADTCGHMIYFYASGCHACALTSPILDELEQEYPDQVIIDRRELHEIGNTNLFYAYLNSYNVPQDKWGYTPTIFINDVYIVGYTQDLKEKLVEQITCEGECYCPFNQSLADYYGAAPFPEVNHTTSNYYSTNSTTTPGSLDLTLPAIVSAALIDSINPCAFAVMIFLLTYLISIGSKQRVLKIGIVYIATVFVTYYLAGLGLFIAVQSTNLSATIYYISAVIAIIAGLINVKDFFWYGKGITLAIPKSAKPTISKWTKKASVPAAIILGFLVSMFELPCTGGVYLAILGLLSNNMTRAQAMLPLLLYNLVFVLPLAVIMGLVYYGVSAKNLEKWRMKKRNYMKLVSGLFMILLGALMLSGLI